MKRYAILPLMAAALAGCAKVAPETVEKHPSEENTPFVIYVGLPGSTKTSFDEEDYTVTWSEGDALAVKISGLNDGKAYEFVKVDGVDNAFSCSDFKPVDGVTYEYDILYPYSSNGQFTMSGGVKTPMHGIGTAVGTDSPNVPLNQLTALIKVTIKNENAVGTSTLTALRVERADGGILGGPHTVDGPVAGNNINYTTVTGQNKKIAAGESIAMYLQCAPFTAAAGSKLLVKYTVDGVEYVEEKTVSKDKDVEFKAGTVNKTSVSFAAEQCIIEGTAVAGGPQLMTKCLEKDNLYAFKVELSEGDFHIRLTGKNGGVYAPVSGNDINDGQTVDLTKNENGHWTVPAAGVYRVVVDFDEKTVAIYSSATDEVVYTATEWINNAVTPSVTEKTIISELWMWGAFNSYSYKNHKMVQSLANPRLFTYYNSGVALPRNGKASVKFMVSNIANNVYAWGASGTQTNKTETYKDVSLGSKTMIYGGQGFNRYAFFVIPEGTNYIELFIGSKDKEELTTVAGKTIVTASDAYVLFDKR